MEHKSKAGTDAGSHNELRDTFDIDIQSCSAMDCTGLIPSLPQSDAEIEHYNQLYHFLPECAKDPKSGSRGEK